jgi:ribonuclease G
MAKEIVVNARKDQTRIAIVEEGDLAELYIENPEHKRTIGNILLGRVRKVMPSIQAAFVDIGQGSDAFLHFSDLSDNLPEALELLKMDSPDVREVPLPGQSEKEGDKKKGRRSKSGRKQGRRKGKSSRKGGRRKKGRRSKRRRRNKQQSPEDLLQNGQHLLVKIAKEPIADKGSRVSTDLSMAGRFLVLVPLTEFVAVSKKISNPKERRRLKALTQSLLPRGFGAIVRTVAEGRDAKSLDKDLSLLLDRWRDIESRLAQKVKAPVTLYEDVDMVSSIIRDEFSSDYRRILIDNPTLYRSIHGYVKGVAPETASSVLMHTEQSSVFEAAGIQAQVDRAFERRVELPTGGYLFIERTEAMHVVDVNSGRSGKGKSQEKNSLDVNLEAARVIARQTRLRDLGGILVVDFIDLRRGKNRKKVYDEMKKEFSRDRAVTKILPMSDFGLVQITRQRLRPSITTTFSPEGFDESEDAAEEAADDRASSIADEVGGPMSDAHRDEMDHLRREVARLKGEMEDPHRKTERLKEDMRAARTEREQIETRARRFEARAGRFEEEAQESREELKRIKEKTRTQQQKVDRRARDARRQFSDEGVPPSRLAATLGRWLEDYEAHSNGEPLALRVHPYAAAYLARSVPSYPARWFSRHLVRVRVTEDQKLAPLDFRFKDLHSGRDLTEQRGRLEEAKAKAGKDVSESDEDTAAEPQQDADAAGADEADETKTGSAEASGNEDTDPKKAVARPTPSSDAEKGVIGKGGSERPKANGASAGEEASDDDNDAKQEAVSA